MFKHVYTTQMSGNAKALQTRFEKINSKPMRLGRLLAFVCTVFLTITIALSTFVLAQIDGEIVDYQIEITNKGEVIELVNKPFVENNTIYVPLREFFTKLSLMETENAKMEWNDGVILINLCHKNLNKEAKIEHTSYMYKIEIAKSELVVNPSELIVGYAPEEAINVAEPMDNAPLLRNNVTYIPFAYAERIIERADNGILSPPDRYKLEVAFSGEVFSIAYPLARYHEITQPFGKRVHPITGEEKFHNGIDIGADEETEVRAGIDGVVVKNGFDEEKGNYVVIKNDIGVEVLYAHLSQITRWDVYEVAAEDVVGKVGNTGMSTGAHLHMEVKINGEYVDPETYFEKSRELLLADVIKRNAPRMLERNNLAGYVYTISDIEINDTNDEATVILLLSKENETKTMTVLYIKVGDLWTWREAVIN